MTAIRLAWLTDLAALALPRTMNPNQLVKFFALLIMRYDKVDNAIELSIQLPGKREFPF